MGLGRNTDLVKQIAERLELPELKQVVKEPTVSEAFRISIFYHQSRAPHSIATLRRGHGNVCQLQLIYDKSPRPAIVNFQIPLERYKQFLIGLRRAKFENLDDAENVSPLEGDVWLVERAVGSFYHNILLSPRSSGHHREVVLAVRESLPEAIREGA
jgi:hypothetical protein